MSDVRLAGDEYTLADVAYTPYLLRLEHLGLFDMVAARPRVTNWYGRCQSRPSFAEALRKWENPKFLSLMKARGEQHWPHALAPSWLRPEWSTILDHSGIDSVVWSDGAWAA